MYAGRMAGCQAAGVRALRGAVGRVGFLSTSAIEHRAGGKTLKRSIVLAFALASAIASTSDAQHALAPGGGYDPTVPRPADLLGYEVGERFTPHHLLHRYFETVAESSDRIALDTVAVTFEGREVLLAVATSAVNHARIDLIMADARRLADPRGASARELDEVVRRMPAIVWLGYTVHGNEASGTEASIAMLYQLAAGQDAETLAILDGTVVLIDPVQNPDGHERHVQDVMRARGTFGPSPHPAARVHRGNWPGARTSHYQFDLNRDWFIHSHPETRGRMDTFWDWAPHVAVDLHEMGSSSTYFFAPPMEPINPNVDPSIADWWEIYAEANAHALTALGESFFRREGYDEFYPGYGVSWPVLTGAIGMTYEQASSGGGAIRRSDDTILTLAHAARNHYATSWATTLTSALRREQRVRDYLAFRQRAVDVSARGAPFRTVLLERDALGRADSLVARLEANGIEVGVLESEVSVGGAREYGATRAATVSLPRGSYAVDLAQPQGRLARALLEPDARLDSSFIHEELEARRSGRPNRFYDVTAWSLPYTFRVRAWTAPGTVAGSVLRGAGRPEPPALPATGGYGYAFEAGSDVSLRMLAGLLADSVRVRYAPRPFSSGGADFPRGAFMVRVAGNGDDVHEVVRRHAGDSGARVVPIASALVDTGTDLGSNSVFPLRLPRVALVGGEGISGNSFGFAWYTLDQRLRYPSTQVDVGSLSESVLADFDVIIIPSASGGALDAELGEAGRDRLASWLRRGGTLVTIEGATNWIAGERTGLSRLRQAQIPDTLPGGGAAPSSRVPGAIVRAVADTLSPLMAGVNQSELPVLVFSGGALVAPSDRRPGEVVIRYAPEERLRLAGYLWPEAPARFADTPYLWTERVGQGRVIAFAGDPNFRDLWRGLLPLFGNAVLLAGSW